MKGKRGATFDNLRHNGNLRGLVVLVDVNFFESDPGFKA